MKEALNHSMNFTQTNTVKEDRNPKITFYVIISDCRHVLSCKLFCRKTARCTYLRWLAMTIPVIKWSQLLILSVRFEDFDNLSSKNAERLFVCLLRTCMTSAHPIQTPCWFHINLTICHYDNALLLSECLRVQQISEVLQF